MQEKSVYRALLRAYPSGFRHEYGDEMLYAFAEQLGEARRCGNRLGEALLWLRAAADVITVAPREHMHMIVQDVRYALRTLAASPGFTTVAILSLALGIGANTAIFSLLNGVLLSTLPVPEPERLVMLSDPDAGGVMIGNQTGERSTLTYAEFRQIRERTDAFSSLMASQSQLDRWQARIDGGEPEEVRGRLVSGDYFRVLGVSPLLGRLFTQADDGVPSGAPFAVLSYDYWQRKFDGSPGVLGKTLVIRKAALTIVGVTPPRFFGESVGQHPDLWVPLSMQPGVLPGRDWLHDAGLDKVMWLHVFGRLRPGLGIEQAQAKANAVFRASLEESYGSNLSAEARREFLDQKLRVRPAAGGASAFRQNLSSPLTFLLVAVGALLLIASSNVANLLLARGAVRQREFALRQALGATRRRMVEQLLTESLVLAAAGGLAGLAAAYLFHRGLVLLVSRAFETFRMSFALDARVLGFSLGLTLAATVVFGLLPALWVTKTEAGASLRAQSQAGTRSISRMRWGRLLVAGQLALSLPLLVGAGLLARTLYNLQRADLGYPRERLVLARVDAQSAGYEPAKRAPLYLELLAEARRIPGVRAASFSENGVFAGRDSGDEVIVEGYTRKGKNDKGSRWDQVGPGYFSTLGIPIVLGREINEGDQAGPPVCVINQAFADLFFSRRNPIGMHITTVYGNPRKIHQIIGVAKDARTSRLRGRIDQRYYVPVTHSLGDFSDVTFELRTAGDAGGVLAALRQIVQRKDSSLPVVDTNSIEQRLTDRMGQERIMARLSLVFGLVALALAAIGLYGVVAYGVERRQSEIGIRMALGAQPGGVVGMVVRETLALIAAGMAVGACLGWVTVKAIENQLYGLSPGDPPTFGTALALLVVVALTAAYMPAWRASRMHPMAALRQE